MSLRLGRSSRGGGEGASNKGYRQGYMGTKLGPFFSLCSFHLDVSPADQGRSLGRAKPFAMVRWLSICMHGSRVCVCMVSVFWY